jgi:hypothetical protein
MASGDLTPFAAGSVAERIAGAWQFAIGAGCENPRGSGPGHAA